MTWRVSKDGKTFYEIEEDFDEKTGLDRSLESAKAKGYKPFVRVTKNGKDVFDIEATEDSLKAAYAKGYKDIDAYEFTKDVGKPGKIESGFRGTINGLTQGFGDELGGAMEAAGAAVGIRGIGSPDASEIHLETDEEDKESLADTYRKTRDRRRALNKAAEEAHPGLYTTGDIAGSVVTGIAAPGTNTLKGSAAIGAVQGLGRSEADLTKPSLDSYGQAAVDTVAGGAMGLAGYGIGKGIEKGVSTAVDKGGSLLRQAHEYLKAAGRGARRGAKEVSEDMPGSWLKDIGAAVGGLKGAVTEIRDLGTATKELTDVAKQARDLLKSQVASGGMKVQPLQNISVIGNGKAISDFTDDEAIVGALMAEGDNPVKKWFAQKAATLQPGQIDADDYARVLGMGSEERIAAREFDPKAAAKQLKPTVEEVQALFKDARNNRFSQLQDAAKTSFDEKHFKPVLEDLESAMADAGALKSIPGSVRSTLDDVQGMLLVGRGTKLQKLTAGPWEEALPAEKFHRLQKARELLDHQISWSKREGLGQAESVLRGLRVSIDDALKTSPEKVEGDALWRAAKELEDKFFGATEFKNAAGGVDVDEHKLARLIGNTDQAGRFKNTMEELRQFARRDDLDPVFKERANALIAELEEKIGKADTKRMLGELRYKNGPSSPAVERMQSAAKGNSLLADAVQAPAGFANQLDQFNKILKSKLGKSYAALDPEGKRAAVKWMVWSKNNPNASQRTADEVFNKLFGNLVP